MKLFAAVLLCGLIVAGIVYAEGMAWSECLEHNGFFYCARILR